MKETPKKLELEAEVLDTDQRKVTPFGGSKTISIPKNRPLQPGWNKFLRSPVLQVDLIRDSSGELCILITKPKPKDGVQV